jgi:hypothetical protein
MELADTRRVAAIGPLKSELKPASGQSFPVTRRDRRVADWSRDSTNKLSPKAALRFLDPVLSALGVSPKLGASLSKARGIGISLREVYRDAFVSGDVARYLEAGVTAGSTHLEQVARRGRLCLVTAILKSAAVRISVDHDSSSTLDVEAAHVATGEVEIQRTDKQTLLLTGPERLAFAFKAIRLQYEDGEYVDYTSADGVVGFELRADSDEPEGGAIVQDDLVEM